MIYHDRHVSPPAAAGCAVDTDVKDWMESVQNSAEPDTREVVGYLRRAKFWVSDQAVLIDKN